MRETDIRPLMLRRQCLARKARTEEEYEALFRLMQPVPPVYFSCPGDPPTLAHRAGFDDRAHNDGLRSRRVLVKGRFQGGTVGYVYADELDLYAAAYRREIGALTPRQQLLMEMLMSEGPLTCAQIKQESGLLVKEIMPDLHRLQEAFLVYEDQGDSDWERGWYVFEREWEGVDLRRYSKIEAISELLRRFLHMNVFATAQGMKSGLRLPARDIAESLRALRQSGEVREVSVGGVGGWVRACDLPLLENPEEQDVPPSVFVLHRSDFLVRSQEYLLRERFAGLEVLQYILVDGEFGGAALGHWRQGPHDVEDVALTLPGDVKRSRKREILDAVALLYSPPFSFIRSYDGTPLAVESL